MRAGAACLLALWFAAPAAAQAPVTSATPVVVRAVWLAFPEPSCAPVVRVAVESPPLAPGDRFDPIRAATTYALPSRAQPQAWWAYLRGDDPHADPRHGRGPGGERAFTGGGVGLAPPLHAPRRATCALELNGTWSSHNRFAAYLQAERAAPGWGRSQTLWALGESGSSPVQFRGVTHAGPIPDPLLFVAVVPAHAARDPVEALDTWRAHARDALTWTWPFFQLGPSIAREEGTAYRPHGSEAALAFFARVPDPSPKTLAALRDPAFAHHPANASHPLDLALALHDDPEGSAAPSSHAGRAPYAYLKQVLLRVEHPLLREQAQRELERRLGPRATRGDPLLRARLGLPNPGPPLWVTLLTLAALIVAGLTLRRPAADPRVGVRGRLLLGGALVWADPVVYGLDLLPDALGVLALFVAVRRLHEAGDLPRWPQAALLLGATLAALAPLTPAPVALGVAGALALTAFGVALALGLARLLDEADRPRAKHAATAAAGLLLLALPLELVLGLGGGVAAIDDALPAPFGKAVWPGLLLIRGGLPLLLLLATLRLDPDRLDAARARRADEARPALEREDPFARPEAP